MHASIMAAGYVRIMLMLVAFRLMPHDYVAATVCYLSSYILDELDGPVARHLHQSEYHTKTKTTINNINTSLVETCLHMMGLCNSSQNIGAGGGG